MKKIFLSLLCLLIVMTLTAQVKTVPQDWHLLDYNKDRVHGISLYQAYDLLKDRTPKQKTIVAVIDSGGDINHEDMKDVLWVNSKNSNKKRSGYRDDRHGWNYVGGADGTTFIVGNTEADREFLIYYKKYLDVDTSNFDKKKMAEYHYFNNSVMPKSKIAAAYHGVGKLEEMIARKDLFIAFMTENFADSTFSRTTVSNARKKIVDSKTISSEERSIYLFFLNKLGSQKNLKVKDCSDFINKAYTDWRSNSLSNYMKAIEKGVDIENKRLATGFRYDSKVKTTMYGNNNVVSEVMAHGTHVGGIIGATRGNSLGMDGIADVRLMFLRIIVEGSDETDRDVAEAIRYAVDHGARIINMSFGKSLSPQQHLVMSAIAYAEKKNVLLIHAAGNNSKNIDIEKTFPEIYVGKKRREVNNMLTIGASGPMGGAALFTNYGENNVHLFAPGVKIYSTVANNEYKEMSGTSMASPVVSGVAALLLNYFPELKAKELKRILIESGVDRSETMTYLPNRKMIPEANDLKPIDFGKLSRSGSIVNACQAVKMVMKQYEKKANEKTK